MSPVKPRPDPLIDEVRERRRELMKEFAGQLDKLFEAVQEIQAQHPARLKDFRKKPIERER